MPRRIKLDPAYLARVKKEQLNIAGEVMGIMKHYNSFQEIKRPEQALNIPFGYEVVGGRYVVNNGEAEIISSIYSMYLSGKTLLGIAEALTEQEVTYFEDTKVWNKNMVSRILADERYLGNETFPRLVDSNNFNLAKNIRAEKGGKKAVLTPLMATVKDKALFEKQSYLEYFCAFIRDFASGSFWRLNGTMLI